jgi:Flp pilus assembly pilin Flp
MTIMNRLWKDESGQDLVEYTLILGFVCLASAALFLTTGTSVADVWTAAKSRLDVAASAAKN